MQIKKNYYTDFIKNLQTKIHDPNSRKINIEKKTYNF